jgi:hypothetical protein
MSSAEVASEATRLRDMPTASYTQRDWSMLDALTGSGVYASRIEMPTTLRSAGDLDRLLPYYRSGAWTKPEAEMSRYIAAWRAISMSDDELRDATKAIIGRDPATFDDQDWRALQAVIDANAQRGNPLRIPTEPQYEHGHDFQNLIHVQQDKIVSYHPDAFRHHFATWMPRLDRTWEARTREATRAIARGDAATLEPNMPTAIAQQGDGDIWRLTGREQVRLAVALLNNGELTTSPMVETPLMLLSNGLDEVDELAPQLAQLRDDTKGLADHNLDVIAGRVASNGYGNHPDYAHVGRVTTNASFIEQALSIPHTAAPARVDPDAAQAVEKLVW